MGRRPPDRPVAARGGRGLTWETDVTFRVNGKIFAMGGAGNEASIKASPMVQADLIDRDPGAYSPAPYVGRFGWVTVRLDRVDETQLRELLAAAWRATAPKRLAATLPAEDGAG